MRGKIRSRLSRWAGALIFVVSAAALCHAGGPGYVAGSSYFDSFAMGQPLTWAQGQVNYYTDQGDLSPILPSGPANVLVANAFSVWTSVGAAAITATNAGQLAEDVNGSNIAVDSSGAVTAPADITPSATGTPVGIVYDYDGTVTDALLGVGAGSPMECFWNAVYGGADNFGTSANFLHALVVINGQCALQSSQLTDVEYRLVRVLGSVLGLGWSQMNLNVITGPPPITQEEYAGFPVMHFMDLVSCVPITICYPNPYQLAPDDVAALYRLYPAAPTGNPNSPVRIYGSVYFADHFGNAGQPMQGVNVVARWIDPSTGTASEEYGASSVSGFLFAGNAGNPVTGFSDPLGVPYSQWGSSDQASEGFFDLGGLPNPDGFSTVQYQLTVEAIDPDLSTGVCPYDPMQVAPSPAIQSISISVIVDAGGEIEQDIVMPQSAQAVPAWATTESWSAPAVIPAPGDWVGSLSGYGDVAYFSMAAQANRTLSVAVTALDEAGNSSESKVAPVVGIWTQGDAQNSAPPTLTPVPFNSPTFGMSRLDAQVLGSNNFIVGIADLRGDGRPDYHYHAHVLYGDSVIPARLPVSGGAITVQGIGLSPSLNVAVGSSSVPLVATNASQILVAAPGQVDGPQTITITDPISGAFSIMTDAVAFGAAATDTLVLLLGGNPPTPVGTQATNPVSVRAVAADGVTPVGGATLGWTNTNNAAFSACGGLTSCSAITDESGIASTWVTPEVPGVATITATLAPGVYNPAQSVAGTLYGCFGCSGAASDIGVSPPLLFIAAGASVSVPLTARVVSNGAPQNGVAVCFYIAQGAGSLNPATPGCTGYSYPVSAKAVTNSGGYALVTLALTNFTANVEVVACVASGSPCQTVSGNAVSPALMNLQAVAGAGQVITGPAFQPLTVRVTDSSTPPNPVLGASVLFQSTVLRSTGNNFALTGGNSQSGMPVILSESQPIPVASDANGLASFLPSVASFTGALQVEIQISAGATAWLQDELEVFPP
jgi:hypothetical protein